MKHTLFAAVGVWILLGLCSSAHGQGPPFGPAIGAQGRAFGMQMAARGQAMGAQGRAFGQGMAVQGRAMGARAGGRLGVDDLQERLLEMRMEMLERQVKQMREAAKRFRN